MDAEYHRRGHNYARRSQFHADLQFLCKMVNCDIGDDQPWVHYCWDADSSGPCCANDEVCRQNSVVACINAMLGKTDPIPECSHAVSAPSCVQRGAGVLRLVGWRPGGRPGLLGRRRGHR
eukprot:9468409-Pyramimonas_sp.AAC.1